MSQIGPANLIPIGSFLVYRGSEQLGQFIGFAFGDGFTVKPQGNFITIEVTGGGGVGPVGPQGPPGPRGFQGLPGTDGLSGAPGAPGTPGVEGPQGDPGADGATGPQGIPGDPGADGATGPQGIPGDPGADGATGPQGIPGDPGADGATGPQGIPGDPGATGADGAPGTDGLNGTNGTDLSTTNAGMWLPPGNATTVPLAIGIAAPTTLGTATARNVAITNRLTQMRRLGYVSAATAGAMCGARNAAVQFWRGNAAGMGGFRLVMRVAPSDAAVVAGARMFCGFSTVTGAPTNVEPNTLTNCLGVCQLSTSNNLHVIHNDASGVATTIDLGADFPTNGNASAYKVTFIAAANGGTIDYIVERIGTAFIASGTLAADLPASNTLMGIQLWRTNNATLLAVGLDLIGLYVETPAFA